MSADTDIADLLTHATQAATGLAGAANDMIQSAVATLSRPLSFPEAPSVRSQPKISSPPSQRSPVIDAVFPPWAGSAIDPPPALQPLKPIQATIDQPFPGLDLPTLNSTQLPSLAPFTVTTPSGQDPSFPAPPNLDTVVAKPAPSPLPPVALITLTAPSVDLAAIPTNFDFDASFAAAFAQFKDIPGLDAALAELGQESTRRGASLLAAASTVLSATFANPRQAALTFQSTLLSALNRRLTAETERARAALNDRSGWDVPSAAQQALQTAFRKMAASSTQDARAQVDAKAAEVALAFAAACGTLLGEFSAGVQRLWAQEIEAILAVHQFSVSYARQTMTALLAEFEGHELLRQEVESEADEARLKLAEAEITAAMARFEVAQANLQVEQAGQDQDAARIQAYQTEIQNAEKEVQKYAAQVAGARTELDLKRRPFHLFALQAKAFDAQINAHEAKINAHIADLETDQARLDVELLKVKAFEAEVSGFESQIATQAQLAHAQAERNAAVVKEFSSKVAGSLAAMEASVMGNQNALLRYQAEAEDALANAQVALKIARQEQDYQARHQTGMTTAYRLTQEQRIKRLELGLRQLKAVADAHDQGGKILETMAHGALSAANGVAAAIFTEEA